MNQQLNELESIYLNLLKQAGLIEIAQAPEKFQESLDAIRSAGWLDEFRNATGTNWSRPQAKLYQLYDSVFRSLRVDVENDIGKLGGKIDGEVFVGGDPIGLPNASVTRFRCGYLVLFHFELVQLLYQLAKILCQSLDLVFVDLRDQSEPRSTASLLGFPPTGWTKDRTIEAVSGVFRSLRRDGTLANSTRQELPHGSRAIFLSNLVTYAERFVLSHEYSHILLGHCDEARDRKTSGDAPLSGLESQINEFAADEMALSLLMASADRTGNSVDGGQDANLRVAGATLLLICKSMWDACRNFPEGLSVETSENSSHPTSIKRYLRLRENVSRRYGEQYLQFSHVVVAWAYALVFPVVGRVRDLDELKSVSTFCVVAPDSSEDE